MRASTFDVLVDSAQGGAMRGRSVLLIIGFAIAAALPASTPASAAPLDKGHFHDVETGDIYNDCGFPAQDSVDVSGNFVFNQRGSSPFPYYRESIHGTVVTTNLKTGGTYTNVFTANSKDQTIVDNGDGTITITTFASGGSRYYDTSGNFVLKDPGEVRFAIDIDYMGTPGNPDDDVVDESSFRTVRSSTGNSDFSDRDFCADLLEFTS
jgi:hypothetical protein